jgi:RNA polymerase sigma factor (sigma-70 family)
MSPRFVLLRSQSDERLVALARAGNERAFTAIVERYAPELHALARRLCSDGRSEDVVQQAFLSAFVALSAGSEVRHLRGWLYQIVRNAAHRPAAPLCVPLDGAAVTVSSVEDVVQDRALAMTTLSELARLPARQRQAMIGTALDGRARAEIASSMGLSEGAVRQLVHRARTALRGAVTAVTPWPLARWLATARPGVPGTAELAAGAGAASSGGVAIKLGALLASGTLLTGAAIDLHAAPVHRGGARAANSVHARPHVAGRRAAVVASVASPASVDLVSIQSAAAHGNAGQGRLVGHAGGSGRGASARRAHHDMAPGQSGGRDGGQRAGRHDGNGGPGGGASSAAGGRDGSGATSRENSGSDGQGRAGGQSGGSNDSGSGSRTGSGSDGGGDAQMASDSHRLDSAVDGSGSNLSSGSGDQSGSGDGAGGAGSTTAGTSGGSGSSDNFISPSGSGGSESGGSSGSGSGGGSGSSGD